MIAAHRPTLILPLFLHVLGAMVLVGALVTVLLLAVAAWRTAAGAAAAVGLPDAPDRRVPGLVRDARRRRVDLLEGRLERRRRPDLARHRLRGRRPRPARAPARDAASPSGGPARSNRSPAHRVAGLAALPRAARGRVARDVGQGDWARPAAANKSFTATGGVSSQRGNRFAQ